MRQGARAATRLELRTPPRESVFLDRKLGGVFIVPSTLDARIRAREVLERYVPLG